MTEQQQIKAFAADLGRLIGRYRSEFNLSLAAAVGTLEVVKLELFAEQTGDDGGRAGGPLLAPPRIPPSPVSVRL